MPAPLPVNSSDLARRLGVTRAAVSRYRDGSRTPQLAVRLVIEKELGWPLGDQARAEAKGRWTAEFNRVIKRKITTHK